MGKLSPLAVILILAGSSSGAFGGALSTFEDGSSEAVAVMNPPALADQVNITLPMESHVNWATMNVSARAPVGNGPASPENIRLYLNDSLAWEYNGTDYGKFGLQDALLNETEGWKSRFGYLGGVNYTKMRIPKGAVILNATVEVECRGHGLNDMGTYISGPVPGGTFGWSACIAGDVNKDGYDDIIAGAPYQDSVGCAYLYLGGSGIDSANDLTFPGNGGGMGYSVSVAGDVNKDGYDDVVIGEPGWNTGAGRTYVYLGGPIMDATPDVTFTAAGLIDNFGTSVSGAGDVNGDGFADVIVGAYSWARLYLGGPAMDNSADVIFDMPILNYAFGSSVSDAGDVNGDGYSDVIIGAPDDMASGDTFGHSFVYYGAKSIDNLTDVTLAGDTEYGGFGWPVSGAGDVNGDGYGDVMVGATIMTLNGKDSCGQVLLFHGATAMDAVPDVKFDGATTQENLGRSLSGAGDIDRDGYDDLILGGPSYTGRAYVHYGGPGMDANPEAVFNGSAADARFGCCVRGGGDVDNDGHPDLVIGAWNNDSKGSNAGGIMIVTSESGLKAPGLSLAGIPIWSKPAFFNGTETTKDFRSEVDKIVKVSLPSVKDVYGIEFVDVPLQVSVKSAGNLTLSGVRVSYSINLPVPEFSAMLNSFILAHRPAEYAGGDLLFPVRVASGMPGRLSLNNLSIEIDEAPALLKPIPDLKLAEDSSTSNILDLSEYFGDSHDAADKLSFRIASCTNGSIVSCEILGNRFLSVDASEGAANDNWTGEVELVTECADTWGSRVQSGPVRILVANVNDQPVIISRPPPTGTGGQEYLYQVVATDGDNDTPTYGLAEGPDNMTIDPLTGLLRWVPQRSGRYDATVTVGDGESTGAQEFTIAVANRAPMVTNTTVPVAYADVPYSYQIEAADDDGDSLSYLLVSDIGLMEVDLSSGRLDWRPSQVADVPVSVAIFDGHDTVTYNFTIRVVQGNRQPAFSSSPVTAAFVGIPYVYVAVAADADKDALDYIAADGPAGLSIDGQTGSINWTPSVAGNFSLKLVVRDGKGGEDVQQFTVTVRDRVKAKIEIASPSVNQKVGGKLTLSGKAMKGTLDIVKVQIRVDTGDWIDVSGNASWQHVLDTTRLKDGKHTIQARAYDGLDYSDPASRVVTVENKAGKVFIPGFGLELLVAAAALLALAGIGRKRG